MPPTRIVLSPHAFTSITPKEVVAEMSRTRRSFFILLLSEDRETCEIGPILRLPFCAVNDFATKLKRQNRLDSRHSRHSVCPQARGRYEFGGRPYINARLPGK